MAAAASRRSRRDRTHRDSPPRLWLAAFCLVALGLRLLYISSIADSPFAQTLQTNPQRYHQWATLILAGKAPLPPFEQAPGYAYLLAFLYRLFAATPRAVLVLQALADSATCLCIGLIALRCCSRRAAIIATALSAGCASMIYFSAELLPATLGLCLLSAATAAAAYRRWLTCGAICALAYLLRSESLLALPVFAALAWPQGWRDSLRVAAPSLVVLALSVLASAAITGKWTLLSSGGGLNLWLGNNPHADGVNPFLTAAIAPTADRIRAESGGDPAHADRLLRRQAMQFFAEFPLQAAGLFWKKLRWTFSGRELPNTSDIEWQQSYSWLFALPQLPLRFSALLIAACAALPFVRRLRRPAWALAGPAAVALLTCTIFFTNARFRLPLLPALIVLAAHGMDQIAPHLRRLASQARRRRPRKPQRSAAQGRRAIARQNGAKLGAAAVAAIAGAWIVSSNPYDVWSYRIPQLDVNAGIAEREAGNFPRAIERLRRGLQAIPDDPIAWIHLALALEQNGDRGAAAEAYLRGLLRSTQRTQLLEMAQRFFVRHRLDAGALDELLQSKSPNVHNAIIRKIVETLRRS